jgi:hypothetical protein
MTAIPIRGQVPRLLVHYAPGILFVLQRRPCGGRLAGWSSLPKHGSNCGCHGSRVIETFVAAAELTVDEQEWCLERCWLPQRQEVTV